MGALVRKCIGYSDPMRPASDATPAACETTSPVLAQPAIPCIQPVAPSVQPDTPCACLLTPQLWRARGRVAKQRRSAGPRRWIQQEQK